MENPEEILHSLEEFSKLRPKDIPRELEDYLCFVAKTGDPVYQWSTIKSLFREKLINVITEFYESCPSIDIPPCPNVDMFNYEAMKTFILEKLDTFAAAPFTVQRICELLTTPRKEYNRIDKYMRALEKNILVVSTTEPGNNRRSIDNPEGIVNGLENDHLPETSNSSNDINVEEMDDSPSWPRTTLSESSSEVTISTQQITQVMSQESFVSDSRASSDGACSSSADTVITCRNTEEPYVFIEPVPSNTCRQEPVESDVSVTITPIPADVQKRRDSLEPVVSTENTEQSESEPSEKTTIPESSTNEAEQAEQVTEVKPEEHEPSEADETADSTSQPQAADEQQEKQHPPEITTEDAEISNSVESTSTEASSEEVKEAEVDSEISAEATPEESEAEKAVPAIDTSAVSPPPVEDVSEIPKHESESEENSKDSEVSSSSSSVTSNDEDSEEASKPSSEPVVADFSSEEKEVSVEEEQKDSNEAENKDPEAMQVDESGDARTSTEDEEVAESKVEETQMDVELADTEKPAESTEGTSSE